MANLNILSTGIKIVPGYEHLCEIVPAKQAVDVNAGQPGYCNAAGKYGLSDGNGSSPANRFRGIFLETLKAGQTNSLLVNGYLQGYDLSGLAYDAQVFVSDTEGVLADAAGTTSLLVGRVIPMNDKDKTKILRVTGWSG